MSKDVLFQYEQWSSVLKSKLGVRILEYFVVFFCT
jgi:hypothetical protein